MAAIRSAHALPAGIVAGVLVLAGCIDNFTEMSGTSGMLDPSLGDVQFASISAPVIAPSEIPAHRHRVDYSLSQVAEIVLDADPHSISERPKIRARAPRPHPDSKPMTETAGAFQLPAPKANRLSPPQTSPAKRFDLPAMRQLPLDYTILELGQLVDGERAATSAARPEKPRGSAAMSGPNVRATGLDRIVPQAGALPGATYWAQVAAFRDEPVAARWYDRVQRRNPEILDGISHAITRADLGRKKGVFYRVRVGPFASSRGARGTCRDLKAAGVDCMVWKSG